MRGTKRLPWTMSEIKVVHEYYPKGGAEEVAKLLPGRTLSSIRMRASHIGARYSGKKGQAFLDHAAP